MDTDTQTIQRQYDEVIAPHYDQDPQSVNDRTLDSAIEQMRGRGLLDEDGPWLHVLDVGVGTGRLLAKLKEVGGEQIRPFGLDLSEKMVEYASQKIPDLQAAVDDAANLDAHFGEQAFDLVCTHFITGYVPIEVMAPKIWARLEEGGYWSFAGGTKAGFPGLQAVAQRRLIRAAFGGRDLDVNEVTCNPSGREDVVQALNRHGFAVREAETFEPELEFPDFEQFMDFGYRGGWLTPFIERLGLHELGKVKQMLLDKLVFPIRDHHSIEIVLAQKVSK
jgi:SAM-dependent methyltransferase